MAVLTTMMSLSFGQIYKSISGEASFFSAATLENIEAKSISVNSILNSTSKDILFIIPMTSFQFEKALMQEHFNEKYVESDKFPEAKYKGKITGDVDFTKDGTYHVSSTGILTIHGVDKSYTEKGTITVKGEQVVIDSQFHVFLKDHKVEIPTVVSQKIAEKVLVKVHSVYTPYKK